VALLVAAAAWAAWPGHTTPAAPPPAAAPAPVPTEAAAVEAAPATPAAVTANEPPAAPTAPPSAAPRASPPPRARPATAPRAAAPAAAAPLASGSVQLAISPWGQVEVDGQAAGTTPPLTRLTLTEGTHTITVRNEDFPPLTVTVQVSEDKLVTLRHRFGAGP
jgi:serine/threonine-protein kinase